MLNIRESAPTRRLIVLGGGGFMMEGGFSPIDRYLVESGGVTRPRICLIATPVGDAESVVAAFEDAYRDIAEPWVLAPFRKVRANGIPLNDIEAGLCHMHVVFVSGGNTRSALAVWREWGIDTALRRAYERGVVISGMSAGGAMWFTQTWSDSTGVAYAPLTTLGWLPHGFCPHFGAEGGARASSLIKAVREGVMPATMAVDDYCAVEFVDEAPQLVLSWRGGASARWITADGNAPVGVPFCSLDATK